MLSEVFVGDHVSLSRAMREAGLMADALIVDAPYSSRTHSGHDEGAEGAGDRASLGYRSWDEGDVARFVDTWAPLTRGWMVSLTDHVLAPAWATCMEGAGRYVFSPLACVEAGSRVRLRGDGPAQWSTFAIVSRPRDSEWLRERQRVRHVRSAPCALPGAYVTSTERGREVTGGKPLSLMRSLVADYSEPGDLVVDPCCGAGTTLLAAKLLGRRWIGSDIDPAHADIARARCAAYPSEEGGTLPLFGGAR
jgi:site-specific DNA-methyltransferase (adenine-specific)